MDDNIAPRPVFVNVTSFASRDLSVLKCLNPSSVFLQCADKLPFGHFPLSRFPVSCSASRLCRNPGHRQADDPVIFQ